MSALYSIGATNQLADALENAGFTPGDLTKLTQFKDLDGIKAVLNGKALIIYPENFIDCDSDPFVFEDWEVEEHKKGGMFKFNPEKISLYLSKQQKKGSIGGHDLRKDLADKPVMNANVLDYLLAHPKLIPKEWKGKYIFFWGTIYRCSDRRLYVRYLYWDGSECYCHYRWLDSDFNSGGPAALAS